jgi:transcriptional regulator with PAS, ATPase and Fis domain
LKRAKYKEIEQTEGKPIRQVLIDLFNEQRLNLSQAAERLGVAQPTLTQWVQKSGLRMRVILEDQEQIA